MKDGFGLTVSTRSNTTLRNGVAIHGNELGYGLGRWIYQLSQYIHSWFFYQPPVLQPINYTKWHKDLMFLFGQKLSHAKNPSAQEISKIFYQSVQDLPQFEQDNLPRAYRGLYGQLMKKFGHRPEHLDDVVRLIPEVQEFHCTKKLAKFKKEFPKFFASSKTYDDVADYINAFLDQFLLYAEVHKMNMAKLVFGELKNQVMQSHANVWEWELGAYTVRIPRLAHLHKPETNDRTHWSHVGVKKTTESEDRQKLFSTAVKNTAHSNLPYGENFDSPLGKQISEKAKAEITAQTQLACGSDIPCDAAKEGNVGRIYPDFVKNMFGGGEVGARAIANLPVLDVANAEGITGYIDYITPRQMTHPVMRGVDRFDRPFIAICHTTDDGNEEVEILFQRYTGNANNWKSAATKGLSSMFRNHGTFFREDVDITHRLLEGQPVGIRNLDNVEGPSALQLCGRGK